MTNSLADIVVKATPGEWAFSKRGQRIYGGAVGGTKIAQLAMQPSWVADAQLIALAPTLATLVLEAREKGAALMRELVWVNEQLDLMPDEYAEAQARMSATLAKLESL